MCCHHQYGTAGAQHIRVHNEWDHLHFQCFILDLNDVFYMSFSVRICCFFYLCSIKTSVHLSVPVYDVHMQLYTAALSTAAHTAQRQYLISLIPEDYVQMRRKKLRKKLFMQKRVWTSKLGGHMLFPMRIAGTTHSNAVLLTQQTATNMRYLFCCC